jgi:hypothetical protein
MGAMGLLSGFVSAVWYGLDYDPTGLRPIARVFLLDSGPLPIGIFFATVIALATAIWVKPFWAFLVACMINDREYQIRVSVRPTWSAIITFVITLYAWSFAISTAIRLQNNRGDDLHLAAASLCAGAVGAGLTHLGCAAFIRELRRPWRVALTVGVGALAGMLFYLGQRKYIDERWLFLIWQPLVAFTIGLGLSRTKADSASL